MKWDIAVDADQPTSILLTAASKRATAEEPTVPLPVSDHLEGGVLPTGSHQFDVGQPVSYADDGSPDIWKGGYEIIELPDPTDHEPQYVIRNANKTYNLIVQEHELRKQVGIWKKRLPKTVSQELPEFDHEAVSKQAFQNFQRPAPGHGEPRGTTPLPFRR
jgi:hypothetical protein